MWYMRWVSAPCARKRGTPCGFSSLPCLLVLSILSQKSAPTPGGLGVELPGYERETRWLHPTTRLQHRSPCRGYCRAALSVPLQKYPGGPDIRTACEAQFSQHVSCDAPAAVTS
ncbi:unnamed protein product [Ectocarpus sp. 12 AP-2014]